MRSPYRDKVREFCDAASAGNHAMRNHIFCDQKETGRVAHGHKGFVNGQGLHVVAVQKFSGLPHQALR